MDEFFLIVFLVLFTWVAAIHTYLAAGLVLLL